MTKTIHIIGAGLAGLSCAIHAKSLGLEVKVYESSPKAGGRIRSVQDKINNCTYDNGTHLIIEGYKDTFEYVDMIGATDQLVPYASNSYGFVEPKASLSWNVPARHLIAHVLKGAVPGVGMREVWTLFKILCARPDVSLSDVLNKKSPSLLRFWEPLILSVFNSSLNEVSIKLLKQTLFELIKIGPNAFRPYFAKGTLEECFIQPALQNLNIQYSKRLIGIENDGVKVTKIQFRNDHISIADTDCVVLALPAQTFSHNDFGLPTLNMTFNPIGNIHFFLDVRVEEAFLGIIGTESQWVYAKNNHVCVTISNFKMKDGCESAEFAKKIWQEIAGPLGQDATAIPNHRIITEKYATPVQNTDFVENRAQTKTRFANLFLCGDWIDTKLPATIESAIRSGKRAAHAAIC